MKKKIKLNLRRIQKIILIFSLVVFSGAIGFRLGWQKHASTFSPAKERVDLSLFWYVWGRLESRYLDARVLDPEKMIYGAISGMVSALGDPYTAFFPPQENKTNREDLDGEFGGVGIQLGYKEKTLTVVSPLSGTPASEAGIRSGDLILKIKDEKKGIDEETEGISLPRAVELIRGEKGTPVLLTLYREGGTAPFEVSLIRDNIVVPSLEEEWLESNGKRIAYVHLLQFTEVMYRQWKDWVVKVDKEKGKADFGGIILDLRNNPGGFLDGAVFVGSEFLENGVIVEQQGSGGVEKTYRVNRQGSLLDVPLVILVNRGSASAAEILAGALQHYKRGELVGEKTFGKGTVQEPEEMPDSSGLHITIARWLLPGGENIDKEGIVPDIEVKEATDSADIDTALEKAKEVLLK